MDTEVLASLDECGKTVENSSLNLNSKNESRDATVTESVEVNSVLDDASSNIVSAKEELSWKVADSYTESNARRKSKRLSVGGDNLSCPVCGAKLSQSDVDSHVASELDRLGSSHSCRPTRKRNFDKCLVNGLNFLEVKKSRQIRSRGRRTGPSATCPICTKTIYGLPEELSDHVDDCLQRQANEERTVVKVAESDSSDYDSDNDYEEYTWAGQTRIRATTMLEGGLRGSGFTVSTHQEDDTELDVVEDDSHIYGQSQYCEDDLIKQGTDSEPEKSHNGTTPRESRTYGSARTSSVSDDTRQDSSTPACESSSFVTQSRLDNGSLSATSIIEALKAKLSEQSTLMVTASQIRCHICMELYVNPVVSIQCWHVYCEDCWLRTLEHARLPEVAHLRAVFHSDCNLKGTKKLCPQCNTITSPCDLRKIFL